uniref:Uncharacterized protein n=1 Tax=Fomitiporia mediterranea TaxID=208960 RepID=A0A5B9RK50_9AGAM|nr:hypothetical protein Fomme_000105 [Fomitiporia mediterranea]QEG57115.1 hypothetical protein Fomme_000105 [Fomitiporia mediterranea]
MKITTIKPNKEMPLVHFKIYLNSFLTQTRKTSQYVYIQVEILYNNSSIYLCNKVLIDLNNKKEIKTLKHLISDNFNDLLKGKPKLKVNKLRFYYIETTKNAYLKYLEELVSSDNLSIKMLNTQEDKKHK